MAICKYQLVIMAHEAGAVHCSSMSGRWNAWADFKSGEELDKFIASLPEDTEHMKSITFAERNRVYLWGPDQKA